MMTTPSSANAPSKTKRNQSCILKKHNRNIIIENESSDKRRGHGSRVDR